MVPNVTPTWDDIPDMPWKSSPSTGHIMGTVTIHGTGAWADGAAINLTGPVSRAQTNDGTGFYAFIDLPPGKHYFDVRAMDRNGNIDPNPTRLEFAVILPAVDVKGALVVAERLRRKVEQFPFPGDGESLHVTISVGVTEFDPEATYASSEIVREADRAMYQSKERGRNRVTVSPAH